MIIVGAACRSSSKIGRTVDGFPAGGRFAAGGGGGGLVRRRGGCAAPCCVGWRGGCAGICVLRPRSVRILVFASCTFGAATATESSARCSGGSTFGIVVKFESPLKSFDCESRSAATETDVGFG